MKNLSLNLFLSPSLHFYKNDFVGDQVIVFCLFLISERVITNSNYIKSMLCKRLIKKQTSEVYFDGEHRNLKEQSIICIIVIWQSIIWSINSNNSHLLEKKQK